MHENFEVVFIRIVYIKAIEDAGYGIQTPSLVWLVNLNFLKYKNSKTACFG